MDRSFLNDIPATPADDVELRKQIMTHDEIFDKIFVLLLMRLLKNVPTTPRDLFNKLDFAKLGYRRANAIGDVLGRTGIQKLRLHRTKQSNAVRACQENANQLCRRATDEQLQRLLDELGISTGELGEQISALPVAKPVPQLAESE